MIPPRTFRSKLSAKLLKQLRRLARDERGAALVEAAISMIVLLILIFGVIEVSWAVYSYHLVANAAHEGARYAMVRGNSWAPASCDGSGSAGSGWTSSRCIASSADIANYVANRSLPGVAINASNVCVQYFATVPASTSTTCTPGGTANSQGNIVQVTVSYPFTLNVVFLPPKTISISSTSQMIIAQ